MARTVGDQACVEVSRQYFGEPILSPTAKSHIREKRNLSLSMIRQFVSTARKCPEDLGAARLHGE
jgi:hypothetical protein